MLQVERFFRQSSNILNMFILFRLCRKDEISRKTRSTLLPKSAKMSKQRSTCSIRQCCFDIVAGVDGALGNVIVREWRAPSHRLRGSASPVLTATGFVNGKGQFSTPHRIGTPQPITKKFVTGDYVGDPYGCAKLGAYPSKGASGHMGEI